MALIHQSRGGDAPVTVSTQITVRARDCLDRPSRSPLIGDVVDFRGQDWIVVGMFMGADPGTREVEAFLVLEAQPKA
jgi:hypothetical protein